MTTPELKNLDSPMRRVASTRVTSTLQNVGGITVGRVTFEPGWRYKAPDGTWRSTITLRRAADRPTDWDEHDAEPVAPVPGRVHGPSVASAANGATCESRPGWHRP